MKASGIGDDYREMTSFSSLLGAFRKARRAKRGKGGEPEFYRNIEDNLVELSASLRDRSYRPSPYRYFSLHNKKERVVSEAAFRDRVVHHALVQKMERVFEPSFIEWSYACRKGKGTHAAVRRARKLARRHRFFLKMDVARYFDNIDHDVLMDLIAEKVGDPDILWLCRTLISCAEVPTVNPNKRRGLPIGNLTSQFWANVYLNPVDQLVVRDRGWGTYLRYMDDMLMFGSCKRKLWDLASKIRAHCQQRLRLEIKDKVTVVAPVTEGIPWLGFRVFSGLVRIDGNGKRRFIRKLKASWTEAESGWSQQDEAVSGAASLCGHLYQADTLSLRRSVLDRLLKN